MGMIKKTKADMSVNGDMAKSAAQRRRRSTAKRSVAEKTGGEKDQTGSAASIPVIPTHVLAAATGAMASVLPKSANAGPGRARPIQTPRRAGPRVLLLAFAKRSFARVAQSGNCTA